MVIPKLVSGWSCVNKVFDRERGVVDSPIWGLHYTLNGFGFEFQVGSGGSSNTSLVTCSPEELLISILICSCPWTKGGEDLHLVLGHKGYVSRAHKGYVSKCWRPESLLHSFILSSSCLLSGSKS